MAKRVVVRYGGTRPGRRGSKMRNAKDVPEGHTVHVVEWGENMYRIANQYDISLGELARLNRRTKNLHRVQVGTQLIVPAPPKSGGMGVASMAAIGLVAALAATCFLAVAKFAGVVKDVEERKKLQALQAEARNQEDLKEQKARWRAALGGNAGDMDRTPEELAALYEEMEAEDAAAVLEGWEEESPEEIARLKAANNKLRRKFKRFMADSKQDDSRLSSLEGEEVDVYRQPPPEGDLYF